MRSRQYGPMCSRRDAAVRGSASFRGWRRYPGWSSRTAPPSSAVPWSGARKTLSRWRTPAAGSGCSRSARVPSCWKASRSCWSGPARQIRRAVPPGRPRDRSPPRGTRARVARASRIYVEGRHDAELVEKIWGDDLRDVGVVVEYLGGIDDLPAIVDEFRPGPAGRLGVLVDHLVAGSKESRIAARVRSPHVLITGHPFIDVWAAVKPSVVGIGGWPAVPPRPAVEGRRAARHRMAGEHRGGMAADPGAR